MSSLSRVDSAHDQWGMSPHGENKLEKNYSSFKLSHVN